MSFFDRLWITFYRFLVMPLALGLGLLILRPFHSKVREGFRLRLQRHQKGQLPLGKAPLWIHCSSGEFEYAKPLIRELKSLHPQCPIYVTYFTPSFRSAIESFEGVDLSEPLVLDLPGPVATRLAEIRPRAVLFARTDVWPELSYQCRQKHIPTYLFSATRTNPTGLQRLYKPILSRSIKWLSGVFTVTNEDAINTHELFANIKVQALGDTRYDQVAHRLAHPKALKISLKPKDQVPVLVAGSTWNEDEAQLLPALGELLRSARLRLILAPHEPTEVHLNHLEKIFKAMGVGCQRYSKSNDWPVGQVLLVDQIGILAELYSWGQLAFIGGSFKRTVHSVMEALAAGLVTFVGPYHRNNREAQTFAQIPLEGGLNAVNPCPTGIELQKQILGALKQSSEFSKWKNKIRAELHSRMGATQKLIHELGHLFAN